MTSDGREDRLRTLESADDIEILTKGEYKFEAYQIANTRPLNKADNCATNIRALRTTQCYKTEAVSAH